MKKWIFIALFLAIAAGISYSMQDGKAMTPAPQAPSIQRATTVQHHQTISDRVVRINQLDPAQYLPSQDYSTWSPSTCSAASMTEVINAYGHHYRLGDILKVEASVGAITSDLGLVDGVNSIEQTVENFGFIAKQIYPTIQQLAAIGNSGTPVIIGFPPDRWSGGHVLVALGGADQTRHDAGHEGQVEYHLHLADSSRLNMEWMPQSSFEQYWGGFAVIVTPKGK